VRGKAPDEFRKQDLREPEPEYKKRRQMDRLTPHEREQRQNENRSADEFDDSEYHLDRDMVITYREHSLIHIGKNAHESQKKEKYSDNRLQCFY